MKNPSVRFLFCSFVTFLLAISGCGSSAQEDFAEFDFESGADPFGAASAFDESQLPPDFPRNLIPPGYESAASMELGNVLTISFEDDAPINNTIERYVQLLGEPRFDNENPARQRTAQWEVAPWMLTVIGSEDESIIGFTKLPQ